MEIFVGEPTLTGEPLDLYVRNGMTSSTKTKASILYARFLFHVTSMLAQKKISIKVNLMSISSTLQLGGPFFQVQGPAKCSIHLKCHEGSFKSSGVHQLAGRSRD